MYYAGESNVPGAPGQGRHVFNPNANVVGPIHSYNPNGVNTTGVNTTGYVGNTPQLTGFMNLPGAVGNMGAIAEAPTVRRDMQGTELVPDPRNPGKFIHPNILQNPGYEQRYRDASKKWIQ